MEFTIEKARPSDAAALLGFVRQIGGESDNLTFGAEGLPLSVQDEAAYLAQWQDTPDGVYLLARCGGQIVGNATLARLPRRMRHRGEFSLAVRREYWNRGLGGQLLRALIDFARSNGFAVLDLQVRSDNAAAIHLYEKFGFVKLGTHPAFFRMEGRDIPFDYMSLRL